MRSLPVLPVLLAVACLAAGFAVQASTPPELATPPPETGNDFGAGYDLHGAGWTMVDVTVDTPTDLRFVITHDTIDNLCTLSDEGQGIYDAGHHTVVHLWRLGHEPFTNGRFFAWLGNPHMALPILQTGVCGESNDLPLAAGETARLVVASTVPGYNVAILGANVTTVPLDQNLALDAHPDHLKITPEPMALFAEDSVGPVVAVDRDWRAHFWTGPAAFYGIPWVHVEAEEPAPIGGFELYGQLDWGYDGAVEHVEHTETLEWRGTVGTVTHWTAVFGGSTPGGVTEGYFVEEYVAGAYAGSYDIGTRFLSVPLEPLH